MSKWKTTALATVLFGVMLLAGTVLAMFSDNFRLDWSTPLTGSGGGPAGSAGFSVDITVGQTAIGVASSSSYQACLGYWCVESFYHIYLPLVLRNHG